MAALLLSGCSDPKGNDPNVPDYAGATTAEAGTAGCPKALPSGCPTSPSYGTDIAPIIQRSCLPCHVRGGVASDRLLDTPARVSRLQTTMFLQLNACLMPPADAGADAALSFEDRRETLQWLVCGAPDN